MTQISQDVFVPSPKQGVAVLAWAYYTHPDKPTMMSLASNQSASDISDGVTIRHSEDNGQTWGEASQWATRYTEGDRFVHVHPRGAYVDPASGRTLQFWTAGRLRTEDPAREGQKQWALYYAISDDAGYTWSDEIQIVHAGPEFNATQPFPGITIGVNGMQLGDAGQRPLTLDDGTLLLPIQSGRQGHDGQYFNPHNAITFTDCLTLRGRWTDDGRLAWTSSDRVLADPDTTTRGLIEPTLGQLSDGRLIMVMRASNAGATEMPGYRWISESQDAGQTWSAAQPWTYEDGQPFYSPSSCSELLQWSDGRLFWLGNICDENPNGNLPRHPLVIGEVDRATGHLIRESVTPLVELADDDTPRATLSNFYAHQDRQTGQLVLYMTKLFGGPRKEGGLDWTADAMRYRFDIS